MPKFAPVAPPAMLRLLKDWNLMGNYHLLLAHDVLNFPEDYQVTFNDSDDYEIIMDNGVVELGSPLTPSQIKMAADYVNASLVVLPDYMRQKVPTLQATRQAAEEWIGLGMQSFMAVPQGGSLVEIMDCAAEMSKIPYVKAWGVGRYIADMLGTRNEVINQLNMFHQQLPIHLLGFSSNLQDDLLCCFKHNVRGIDSAVPIRMGMQNKVIRKDQVDPGPRGTYWEDASRVSQGSDWGMIVRNMELMREWVG